MADILIELQVKGEREATQALKRFSDASGKLNRSVLDAASKVESTTKAWDRANKLYEKSILNADALKAAQIQLARELAVTNGYLKSNGALNTQKALAELKSAQATREAAEAEARANAERQRAQQSYNQLRATIDQSYNVRMRLRQAAQTLRAAEEQGIITREQAIAQLKQYRAVAQQAAIGTQFASRRLNGFGVVAQQTGYQVGDFIVQIQSGTNVFVALGQQLTQLIGTFGIFAKSLRAIMLISGIGIIVPILTAIGAAFMRTREAAKESASGAQEFESALQSARSEISSTREELRLLQSGFEEAFQLAFTDDIRAARKELEAAQQDLANLTVGEGITRGLLGALPFIGEMVTSADRAAVAAAQERVRLAEAELVAAEALVALKNLVSQQNSQEISDGQQIVNDLQAQVSKQQALFGLEGEALRSAQERLELQELYQELLEAGVEPMSDLWNEAVRLLQTMQSNAAAAERLEASLSRASKIRFSNLPFAEAMEAIRQFEVYGEYQRSREAAPDQPVERTPSTPAGTSGAGTTGYTGIFPELQAQVEAAMKQTAAYQEEIKLLDFALDKGMITQEGYNRAVAEAQEYYNQAADAASNYEEVLLTMANTASSAIGDAMMSIVDGTKSAKDAFKDMARVILKEAFELLVVNTILNAIFGTTGLNVPGYVPKPTLGGGYANGGVFQGGAQVTAFATGGVVGSPTFFPMANGGVGLMGEAGPEAIMPLKRGKGGRLGVEVSGEQGNVTINQTFAFQANGDESVKRIIASEAPKIAALTQKQMLDARRRGGVVRDTFA